MSVKAKLTGKSIRALIAAALFGSSALLFLAPTASAGGSNSNHADYWEASYGTCEKQEPVSTPYQLGDPPEGNTWTALILKAGSGEDENTVIASPESYTNYSHGTGKGISHAIYCWSPAPTTTTEATTTTVEETTTTVEETTTTEPEDDPPPPPPTTVVAQTTTTVEETTTTVEETTTTEPEDDPPPPPPPPDDPPPTTTVEDTTTTEPEDDPPPPTPRGDPPSEETTTTGPEDEPPPEDEESTTTAVVSTTAPTSTVPGTVVRRTVTVLTTPAALAATGGNSDWARVLAFVFLISGALLIGVGGRVKKITG